MSATPAEFAHGLALAFGAQASGNPGLYRIVHDGAAMEIETRIGPVRTIASLSLPTLQVRIRFTAGSPAQRAKMLHCMDRAMQRGGG